MMEPSSSITVASSSSSVVSNGSSRSSDAAPPPPAVAEGGGSSMELVSLSRLSCNLERLLVDSELDCSDADIVVEGAEIGVHRCILAARSRVFYERFAGCAGGGERPRLRVEELVPGGGVGREALMVVLGYLYTGKLRPPAPEVMTCVDRMCPHDACRPAIGFVIELAFAASALQIPELVSWFQRRLLNFVEKAQVEDVFPIVKVAFKCHLDQLLTSSLQRLVRTDVDDLTLEKELPGSVADQIKQLRQNSVHADSSSSIITDPTHEKRVRRIHKALDSDDVELVKLLLSESEITLDDANALHYAVSYCDAKVVTELLDLGLVNVNLRNGRGYTPLHLSAMRKDPAIIIALLNKGASVSGMSRDGQNAVSICRRLTRQKDYTTKVERGQESNKDRLCVEILEREMMRTPVPADDAVTSPLLADHLHMTLLHLENRVAFARLFFPAEAKVAMQLAQADPTFEFVNISANTVSNKLRDVDLNEPPAVQNKRLRERVDALMRTVELGRRYFPHCSQVLDKFLEDDLLDESYMERDDDNADEQKMKRIRLNELKQDVQKAFSKDVASHTSSCLSSPPVAPPSAALLLMSDSRLQCSTKK